MSQFQTTLAAFDAATNSQIHDAEYGWMMEAVETQETIEQFVESSKHWAERSTPYSGTIGGLPYTCWSKVQARKGATRRSMCVIDFGDRRMAIDCDIRFYE